MAEEAPYDVEELRTRFPWVGLGPDGETELSSTYREIMAQTRVSREIVDAIDEIRRAE
ncbi:hypothetical protein [Haloechinothrix salitolerans]|uniref:Uncharacterized protein n=1 Tax=Haloechinothrix salitolerans TaxID=926830 RepID=A0ABW2BZ89_9PSEU